MYLSIFCLNYKHHSTSLLASFGIDIIIIPALRYTTSADRWSEWHQIFISDLTNLWLPTDDKYIQISSSPIRNQTLILSPSTASPSDNTYSPWKTSFNFIISSPPPPRLLSGNTNIWWLITDLFCRTRTITRFRFVFINISLDWHVLYIIIV